MERQPANAPVDYGQEMDRHSRQSIATLVLGIAGLVLAFWPVLAPAALVVNAAALILGLLLRRRTRRINIPEDRKNVAGRWCALIGLVFVLMTAVLLVVSVLGAANAGAALPGPAAR